MIEFNSQQKSIIVDKIKAYFDKELHQDIGQFEAEFLLDFFAKEVGAYFYNKGIEDSNAVINSKFDEIQQALFDIELPEPR
jgi:uncharacterized protein (DUF2164 family)